MTTWTVPFNRFREVFRRPVISSWFCGAAVSWASATAAKGAATTTGILDIGTLPPLFVSARVRLTRTALNIRADTAGRYMQDIHVGEHCVHVATCRYLHKSHSKAAAGRDAHAIYKYTHTLGLRSATQCFITFNVFAHYSVPVIPCDSLSHCRAYAAPAAVSDMQGVVPVPIRCQYVYEQLILSTKRHEI